MEFVKKFFCQPLKHYIGALTVAAVAAVYRIATLSKAVGIVYALYEVFSVSGFVTFLVGGLLTVAYWGAFDMFGYAFSPKNSDGIKKHKTYTDYANHKAEKRARNGWYFTPYYIVGLVLVLISDLIM